MGDMTTAHDANRVLLPYGLAGRDIFVRAERDCVWLEVDGCTPLQFNRTEHGLETTAHGGRVFGFHDLIEIHRKLNQRCGKQSRFDAVRLQAFCHLLWAGALRPKECLDLNLNQVLERDQNGKLRVNDICLLSPTDPEHDLGYYAFWLDPDTYRCLDAYLQLAVTKGWIDFENLDGPVFVGSRGFQGKSGHNRWSKNALDRAWQEKRKNMKLDHHYTLRDFRHTAIFGCSGTPEERALFARLSVRDVERRYTVKDAFGFGKMWMDVYNACKRLDEQMGPLYEVKDVRALSSDGSM
jgi:hypothetical protein